jgi:hypothetical protein
MGNLLEMSWLIPCKPVEREREMGRGKVTF